MHPKLYFINKKDDNNYHYIAGEIENDVLNGYGRECIKEGKIEYNYVGKFKNGKLNGIGAIYLDDKLLEFGFYEDGKLIDIEEYKNKTNRVQVEDFRYYNKKFKNIYAYGECYDFNNAEGYVYIESDETIEIGFYYEEKLVKGNRCIKQFYNYKDNKPYDLRLTYYEDKKEHKEIVNLYLYQDDVFLQALLEGRRFNYHKLIFDEIKIEEGTKILTTHSINIKGSVIIHLPHSIETLEKEVFNYETFCYYVEVYYDGTKEEWNKIKKGGTKIEERSLGGTSYYYHGDDSYYLEEVEVSWAYMSDIVVVHCKDGDIK